MRAFSRFTQLLALMMIVFPLFACSSSGGGSSGKSDAFTIKGRIVDADGSGVASATLTIVGKTIATTTTDSGGYWQFKVTGSAVVTPSKAGYLFVPASREISGPDDSGDFTAQLLDASGPAAIAALVANNDTTEAGLWLLLESLGIGVYTPDGYQLLAGSERKEDDFWLYDFQIPMLVSLVQAPTSPFTHLVDELSEVGLEISSEDLLSLYQSVYTIHAETFLVQFLLATGLDFSSMPQEITALQQWLLLLDTVVPPNRTELNDAAPLALNRDASCLISGPALSGWGFVYGASNHAEVIAAEAAFTAINAPLFRSSLDIRLTFTPEIAREGTCGPGEESTLTVEVYSSFVPIPVAVTCGYLTGMQLPGMTGFLEGAEVEWSLSPVLEEHGTVRLPDGSPYLGLASKTDAMGQTSLIYEPHESELMGLGAEVLEPAIIWVTVDAVPALRLAGITDQLFLSLIPPARELETMYVAWYMPGPVQSSGMMTGGGWTSEGQSYNPLGPEGQWTTQTTLTGPYGTLAGSSTYTMPPRPKAEWWEENRFLPWESEPYQLTMSGQQTIIDVLVDTDATYDIVSLIRCENDVPHFDISSCTVNTTTTVTGPDFSHTVTDTSTCEPGEPWPIGNAP
ncbi:carboxypeptidase-like regulatory domain-containing protein [Desulfurivibrio alkaliphilus]|uniref:Carboxypeptidase regulatory-like domain-containing protein n=1 Tax=Desulfurivibrio alkaliphilus (strain DSM 19089 / UNIQEM U267 / AHT2) TaxID=589865 RepID=D6Z6V3_DESAT|nr:carboxypeptidase-like regulatory domain-containing protein [Desulfurivibrio alkaliphilus]ADH86940.1 hypothetical protein DaAHT2_2275 [Desulfurivibrio alkaliphilus AHT 2]